MQKYSFRKKSKKYEPRSRSRERHLFKKLPVTEGDVEKKSYVPFAYYPSPTSPVLTMSRKEKFTSLQLPPQAMFYIPPSPKISSKIPNPSFNPSFNPSPNPSPNISNPSNPSESIQELYSSIHEIPALITVAPLTEPISSTLTSSSTSLISQRSLNIDPLVSKLVATSKRSVQAIASFVQDPDVTKVLLSTTLSAWADLDGTLSTVVIELGASALNVFQQWRRGGRDISLRALVLNSLTDLLSRGKATLMSQSIPAGMTREVARVGLTAFNKKLIFQPIITNIANQYGIDMNTRQLEMTEQDEKEEEKSKDITLPQNRTEAAKRLVSSLIAGATLAALSFDPQYLDSWFGNQALSNFFGSDFGSVSLTSIAKSIYQDVRESSQKLFSQHPQTTTLREAWERETFTTRLKSSLASCFSKSLPFRTFFADHFEPLITNLPRNTTEFVDRIEESFLGMLENKETQDSLGSLLVTSKNKLRDFIQPTRLVHWIRNASSSLSTVPITLLRDMESKQNIDAILNSYRTSSQLARHHQDIIKNLSSRVLDVESDNMLINALLAVNAVQNKVEQFPEDAFDELMTFVTSVAQNESLIDSDRTFGDFLGSVGNIVSQ